MILYEYIVSRVYGYTIGLYPSEYINSEKNESFNNFRNETDNSTIVRLKCPSYCPFNMHIMSLSSCFICYIPVFIDNACHYLWHEFRN